eukprot:CCRYP_016634-RA/>CCRYP_016634-RA protein AED:0.35 eAED:0.35 QI:0/0/0/1/0/0/2/0/91
MWACSDISEASSDATTSFLGKGGGRKFPYFLMVCVNNDDKRKIHAYLSGFPGSTHDNRVWRNMIQNQKSSNFLVLSSTSCVILLLNQGTLR